MQKLNIGILGLAEVRWPGSGTHCQDDAVFYYSGGEDGHHTNGVGIIMHKNLKALIINFVPYNDRMMLLRNLIVVQFLAFSVDAS